jgi:hypothetical protein
VFFTWRASDNDGDSEFGYGQLVHGGENLLLDLTRDVVLYRDAHMTVVPELSDLFLKWEQDAVERFVERHDSHSPIQPLFECHAIQRIQGRNEFTQQPAEHVLDDGHTWHIGSCVCQQFFSPQL